MSYYQRIKDLREDKDLRQEDIAKIFNMHKTTYCRYEQGKSTPTLDIIIEIAKFYKVSIDYIAGLTNDKGGLHKNTTAENEILNKYNALSDIRKGRVLQLLDMLTEEQQNEDAQSQETA
ncbi:MAG: helix-turn-helix transcriptional regulator [Ruminococcus sp.]|nr:helix-turn-helix transcriptional regulator [Ruminococcus sp.]